MKVVALREMINSDGSKIPWGTEGEIVDRYVYGPHRYVVVKFENGVVRDFGDETHPLISYKGCIKIYEPDKKKTEL